MDEPHNYLALPELEPLLYEWVERCDDLDAQLLLVSHHPEFLDRLAPDYGVQFVRDGLNAARVRPYEQDSGLHLPASEVIARGWDRE